MQSNDLSAPRKNLGVRTEEFAHRVRIWARKIHTSNLNRDDIEQVIRSSGSVAAAHEGLGKGDRRMKMRICRKEASESRLWLRLLDLSVSAELNVERLNLCKEADELTRIFHSILEKHYKS